MKSLSLELLVYLQYTLRVVHTTGPPSPQNTHFSIFSAQVPQHKEVHKDLQLLKELPCPPKGPLLPGKMLALLKHNRDS